MFDFSMSEVALVMVVALVVIGPERLPKVARTMGHLYSRAQRYLRDIKSDISRDLAMEDYHKIQEKFQQEAQALQQVVKQAGASIEEQRQQIHHQAVSPVMHDTVEKTHAASNLPADKPDI
jgi:sec-independent protein translocase protein TatB